MLSTPECAEQSGIDSMNVGSRFVLTPTGSVTHENCHQYKEKIEDAIQGKKAEIILDCRQVDHFDSAALEFLVQTHAELRSKGGTLKIVGLNDICRDILLVTRVMNVLFVYKDIHDAIRNMP